MTATETPESPAGETAAPAASPISRRRFLTATAAVGGAAALGGLVGFEAAQAVGRSGATLSNVAGPPIPFHGRHQAGILTPAQDRLAFAAFDVTSGDRAQLVELLKTWTAAAARFTAGLAVADGSEPDLAPPRDTGEATGLPPARLTITIGFGPSLFDNRFGLAARRPAALADLPRFAGDALDPARSGGDIAIQACSDDPQVAFHAVRNLARLGRGVAVIRWFQLGFGRTSSTSSTQETPRNLLGFKDGTNNIVAEDADAVDRFLWVGDGTDQPWLRDGSYLVARRIRMRIESWDRASLGEQEQIIGRSKVAGAPLGAQREHDPVDLAARTPGGDPLIAPDAHIRLAAPSEHANQRILRRGYSFTEGIDPLTGELEAGLFFICFQQDPGRQFVPLQARLAATDTLNEYIRHTGSAVFACPPGVVTPGDWWGESLFA